MLVYQLFVRTKSEMGGMPSLQIYYLVRLLSVEIVRHHADMAISQERHNQLCTNQYIMIMMHKHTQKQYAINK